MTAFGSAFKAARAAGKKTFKWNGKLYNTKLREETRVKTPVPTPRPDTKTTTGSGAKPVQAPNRPALAIPTRDASDPRPATAVAKSENAPVAKPQPRPVSHGKTTFYKTHKSTLQLQWPKPLRVRGGRKPT